MMVYTDIIQLLIFLISYNVSVVRPLVPLIMEEILMVMVAVVSMDLLALIPDENDGKNTTGHLTGYNRLIKINDVIE